MNNIIKIGMYRFVIEAFDEETYEVQTSKGFVAAISYADAAARLTEICKIPSTGKTTLISMNLYEIDAYDGKGIIEDNMITEVWEDNKND